MKRQNLEKASSLTSERGLFLLKRVSRDTRTNAVTVSRLLVSTEVYYSHLIAQYSSTPGSRNPPTRCARVGSAIAIEKRIYRTMTVMSSAQTNLATNSDVEVVDVLLTIASATPCQKDDDFRFSPELRVISQLRSSQWLLPRVAWRVRSVSGRQRCNEPGV